MARLLLLSALLFLNIGLSGCGIDGLSHAERAVAAFESGRYLDAKIHLANAIDDDPTDTELYQLFGETALALGDGQSAETAFQTVAEQQAGDRSDTKYFLAHAHLMQGEASQALELIGDAPQDNAYALRLLAQASILNGDREGARNALDLAIAAAPNDAAILALFGQYHLSLGNLTEGSRFARRAINASSQSVEAYLLMGRIHTIQGEYDLALRQYDAGIERFRDHTRLYLAKAAIHADRGEFDEMERAISHVERIMPRHPAARYILLRHAVTQGDLDEAIQLAQGLEDAARNNPPLLLLLGELQIRRGNEQQGINYLREYARFFPHHESAILALAMALSETGDIRQAYSVIEPVASRAESSRATVRLAASLARQLNDPGNTAFERRARAPSLSGVEAELEQVNQAIESGDWQSASDIFDTVLGRGFGDHPMILNNAAMTNLRAGNGQIAVELAERALELAPNDPSVLDTMGWIRLNIEEDRQGSLRYLRRAHDIDPNNMQIRLHLAQALVINGARDEAREHIEILLNIADPRHIPALQSILG